MIELDKVSIKYGDLEAVRPISFKIEKGEFFTLLGPSGCGKTTILRAIAGFVPVAGGSVRIDGKDVTSVPPEKRDVGIVFQNYALFPHMSVADNINFGLKVAKTPRGEARAAVDRVLDATGIASQKHKKPAELSGGQQQRVAIARSLVMGTQVLLFDEPLSNLDAKVRDDMRHEIKRLQREIGFTAVFVTHDQEEALSMSDRLLVINNGRAEQIGTARELYDAPKTPFVCQFVGASNKLAPKLCQKLGLPEGHQHYIRPENISIALGEAKQGISARIVDVDYLGPTTRLVLDVEAERISTMALSGKNVSDLAIGQAVSVALDPSSVFSFGDAS